MHRHTHARNLIGRLLRPRVSLPTAFVAAATLAATVFAVSPSAHAAIQLDVRSLDGSNNNLAHPDWGKAGTNYLRVAPANYADGRSAIPPGPNARFVSNRIFSDRQQNVFSENRGTQWLWTWGQFVDHNVGLRDESGTEVANIPFDANDPLEEFTDTLGVVPFTRTKAAAGTGVTNTRQEVNTTNAYISGHAVYGPDNKRLDWLREGSLNGNPTDNSARMLMPNNFLPRATSRGNASNAPVMAIDGRLAANPTKAFVAGDVRGNENIALTATHTLFAREHNRIVAKLAGQNDLTEEQKFQIARKVVGAEIQYITYNEFLPAEGVNLPRYAGYNPNVNAGESNEFAATGYRAHSQIHGEFELETAAGTYTPAELSALKAAGVEVAPQQDGSNDLAVSLNLAFFNPDLLPMLKLGPFLKAIGGESQYNNDEQMDNHLRSVLFQVPNSTNPECLDDPRLPACFKGVSDLAAIDIQRTRDHGIPLYNDLRKAYGLAPKTSFTAITGEATDQFPAGLNINNPAILDYTSLKDIEGNPVAVGDPAGAATSSVRRTTLAARLKAIYGTPDKVDAFVGLQSEKHVPGTEMGELENAIWSKQFAAFRDGDRFFYQNDKDLRTIQNLYGLDFKRSLADVIADNTDVPRADLEDDVFLTPDDDLPASSCTVTYKVASQWTDGFEVAMTIKNNSNTPINGWKLEMFMPTGQRITQLWNGKVTQNGASVTVTNTADNVVIPANGTMPNAPGFLGNYDTFNNAIPPNIRLNGKHCARE